MGDVIRKSAAADDIIADVRATLVNATARGGAWQTGAEEKLGASVALFEQVESRIATATTEAAPVSAALAVADDHADRFLGELSDTIWNRVGRPATDPALSVLFPGGIAFYAEGDTSHQPERMVLLAELLESGLHPKLDAATGAEMAREVRREADTLRAAVTAAGAPRTRLALLQRVKTSVARMAQMELANLKRRYRSEGFSEAEIHAIIPDRGRSGTGSAKKSGSAAPVDGGGANPG